MYLKSRSQVILETAKKAVHLPRQQSNSDTMWFDRCALIFWRPATFIRRTASLTKMEAVGSSKMLIPNYQSTVHIPENCNLNIIGTSKFDTCILGFTKDFHKES
jgi:hypothetical protein